MKIIDLKAKQLLLFCKSCLKDYINILSKEDIEIIKNNQGKENELIKIAKKIWDYELSTNEYLVISWNKYAFEKEKNGIVFATFSKKEQVNTFCNLNEGTIYEITYEAIIGGLNKDGATLIEEHENEYTIGKINNKYINSYNGATKIITPQQLLDTTSSPYLSKHNELILDASKIKEIAKYKSSNNKI